MGTGSVALISRSQSFAPQTAGRIPVARSPQMGKLRGGNPRSRRGLRARGGHGRDGFHFVHHSQILYNNAMINGFRPLEASHQNGVRRYLYSSSACIYPEYKQTETMLFR